MNRNRITNFFLASIFSAFHEMRQHKIRSFLSIFGITIGIAAFAAMQSIGTGFRIVIENLIAETGGLTKVMIQQKRPLNPQEAYLFARSPGLRFLELDSMQASIPGVSGVYKQDFRCELKLLYKGEGYRCCVYGLNKLNLGPHKILFGRTISDYEFESSAGVCLLPELFWNKISKAHNLKPKDLLGKRISVDVGISPRVVGIIKKTFHNPNFALWNGIFVPFKFYQKHIAPGPRQREMMAVKVENVYQKEAVKEEITDFLIASHRGVEDFKFVGEDWLPDFKKQMNNVNFVFMLIVSLGLLVGGLNIMNMMLVSISTRIREIGLRNALGATRFQIFLQFIIEAAFLSCVGGIFGLLLGALPAAVFADGLEKAFHGLRPVLNQTIIASGVIISMAVGMLFGLYPALKAQRLNPVTALQYE